MNSPVVVPSVSSPTSHLPAGSGKPYAGEGPSWCSVELPMAINSGSADERFLSQKLEIFDA